MWSQQIRTVLQYREGGIDCNRAGTSSFATPLLCAHLAIVSFTLEVVVIVLQLLQYEAGTI